MAVPAIEAAAGGRREIDEDRRHHERGDRPEQLDDGEDALEVGRGSEKPATNSAGATVAPSPSPVKPEPSEGQGLAGGHLDAEDRDPGRQAGPCRRTGR